MFEFLAAESSSPTKFNWAPAVTTLIVFVGFFAILAWKVWPQILKGLDDRQNKIREEIAAAEEARRLADEARAEYQSSLAEARKEAAEMIAKARSDAKAVADELRTRNERELGEMRDRATRDIASAKRAAIMEIHTEAATLAASIASRILKREITANDQQQLVEESLQELARVDRN